MNNEQSKSRIGALTINGGVIGLVRTSLSAGIVFYGNCLPCGTLHQYGRARLTFAKARIDAAILAPSVPFYSINKTGGGGAQ